LFPKNALYYVKSLCNIDYVFNFHRSLLTHLCHSAEVFSGRNIVHKESWRFWYSFRIQVIIRERKMIEIFAELHSTSYWIQQFFSPILQKIHKHNRVILHVYDNWTLSCLYHDFSVIVNDLHANSVPTTCNISLGEMLLQLTIPSTIKNDFQGDCGTVSKWRGVLASVYTTVKNWSKLCTKSRCKFFESRVKL